jgi:threonine dehydratase
MASLAPFTPSSLAAVLAAEVSVAASRIPPYIRRTPLDESPLLASQAGARRVFLKLESEQVTGSFKARGAVNKVLSLGPEERARGVCTASTGNHALAVSYALRTLPGARQIPALIFLPRSVAPAKLEALRAAGAPLRVVETDDCLQSELAALAHARETKRVFVSPYNDVQVMAGQGTMGVEIVEQAEHAERLERDAAVGVGVGVGPGAASAGGPGASVGGPLVVLVPTGGGGMVAGVAAAVKKALPFPRSIVLAAQPATNACMLESVRAGRVVEEAAEGGPASSPSYVNGATWSDGTAGGIEDGAITFEACRNAVTTGEGVAHLVREARAALASAGAASSGGGVAASDERLVDGVVTAEEGEIEDALRFVLAKHHKVRGAVGYSGHGNADSHSWSLTFLLLILPILTPFPSSRTVHGGLGGRRHCLHAPAREGAPGRVGGVHGRERVLREQHERGEAQEAAAPRGRGGKAVREGSEVEGN